MRLSPGVEKQGRQLTARYGAELVRVLQSIQKTKKPQAIRLGLEEWSG
ncbi:hypothetical protein [Actinacidiphila cocklensis]|nr:hypothetical protein [Actinacidiphila cocklensis]